MAAGLKFFDYIAPATRNIIKQAAIKITRLRHKAKMKNTSDVMNLVTFHKLFMGGSLPR